MAEDSMTGYKIDTTTKDEQTTKSMTDAQKQFEFQYIINFYGNNVKTKFSNYEETLQKILKYFENLDKQLKIRKSIYIQENHYRKYKITWQIIIEMNKTSHCIVGMDILNPKEEKRYSYRVISSKDFEINKPNNNDKEFYWSESLNYWCINSDILSKINPMEFISPNNIDDFITLYQNKNEIIKMFVSRSIVYSQALKSEKLRKFVIKNFNENGIISIQNFYNKKEMEIDDNKINLLVIIEELQIKVKKLEETVEKHEKIIKHLKDDRNLKRDYKSVNIKNKEMKEVNLLNKDTQHQSNIENEVADKLKTCELFLRLDTRKQKFNLEELKTTLGLNIIKIGELQFQYKKPFLIYFKLEIPENQKTKAHSSKWKGISVKDYKNFNKDG